MEILLGLIVGKIKQLPPLERPREKAIRYGIDKLSNGELLAIIIGSGFSNNSSLELGNRLLIEGHGLSSLIDKNIADLLTFKGIGKATALRLLACFEIANRSILEKYNTLKEVDEDDLYHKYFLQLSKYNHEVVVIVILDKQKQIIYEETLFKGEENKVSFSIVDIIKKIILHNGKYFYIIHNHPSNHLSPSENDVILTHDLIKESHKMKIELIDHLIITRVGYYSFRLDKSFLN